MDDTIIIIKASRCLSIMNIHGARRAGRRRSKAYMGWSWAAAYSVQGRGHIVRPRAQLVISKIKSVGLVDVKRSERLGDQ